MVWFSDMVNGICDGFMLFVVGFGRYVFVHVPVMVSCTCAKHSPLDITSGTPGCPSFLVPNMVPTWVPDLGSNFDPQCVMISCKSCC